MIGYHLLLSVLVAKLRFSSDISYHIDGFINKRKNMIITDVLPDVVHELLGK